MSITLGGLTFSLDDFASASDPLAHTRFMPAVTGSNGEVYPQQIIFPDRIFQAFLYETINQRNQVGLSITGSSASSFAIASSGTITPTLSTGKGWVAGSRLRLTASGGFVEGVVNTYNGTTGLSSIALDLSSGTGTFNNWTVSLTGVRGATGASGAGTGDMLAANNLSDLASMATARINLGLDYGRLANFMRIFG